MTELVEAVSWCRNVSWLDEMSWGCVLPINDCLESVLV